MAVREAAKSTHPTGIGLASQQAGQLAGGVEGLDRAHRSDDLSSPIRAAARVDGPDQLGGHVPPCRRVLGATTGMFASD